MKKRKKDVISIKSPAEAAAMRAAGKATAEVLAVVCAAVREGISTAELDRIAGEELARRGMRSACRGYPGHLCPFPANICVSINEEVVHGIPSPKRFLATGDLVSMDLVVVESGGFMGDATRTVVVGKAKDGSVEYLLHGTECALAEGIAKARAGNFVGDISAAIEACANRFHLGIVRELTGHGIGQEMHEAPTIPNHGKPASGPLLQAGMTLAIEPMLLATAGGERILLDADGWTVRTADGSWAAHCEHTVLVTDGAPEILTEIKS
ncbi:MAG: type I methionyl aminopeptidase [Puniceicoccales bacterium]|jgi:methionyl aminopeptidase|nr:type I methionyl aminopeptidase [Puniceicoccales bacterium]